jgi:hypothetical protein
LGQPIDLRPIHAADFTTFSRWLSKTENLFSIKNIYICLMRKFFECLKYATALQILAKKFTGS